ncbi:unnamed protein product, partial [Laminaria digitata]
VDKTLGEFPGLLVVSSVPCPACMERRPGDSSVWGCLPLEVVELKRSCPEDLPPCTNNCRLQELQKRLMFVGEMHPAGEDGGMWYGMVLCDVDGRHHTTWNSPLPELGAPTTHGVLGVGGGGLGVPKVDSLYPAVCPIAMYDFASQR